MDTGGAAPRHWPFYTETSSSCEIVQRLDAVTFGLTGGCLRCGRAAPIKGCGFSRGLQTTMIIACPKCATSYTVDSTAFGNQLRTVRCSACGHAWRQSGETEAPDTPRARVDEQRTPRKKAPRPQRQAAQAQEGPPTTGRAKAARRVEAKPSAAASIVAPQDKPAPVPQPSVAPAKPKRPQEPAPAAVEAAPAIDTSLPIAGAAPASSPEAVAPPPAAAAEHQAPARGWISSSEEKESAEGDLDFATETEPAAAEPTTAAGEPPAADAEPTLSAAARADAREQLLAAQKRNGSPQRRAWIVPAAAVAALVVVVGGLIVTRDGIVRRFPATAGAYSALGMGGQQTLGAGLEFRDVSSSREWSGAEEVLVIQGVVANVLKDPATLLPVRVALYDSDDQEVQAVTVPNDQNRIKPGESVRFEARIANPSLSAQRIRVSFATPGAEKAS